MAKTIKGITVEIGGDTTQLDKALKGVNKELKGTQGDLKAVDRLLKLDPTNVTLLEQKSRGMAEAIEATSKKLKILQAAAEQAKQKLDIGEVSQRQYDELQRAVIKAENELRDLERQSGNTGDALDSLSDDVKKTGDATDGVGDKLDKVSKGVAAVGAAAFGAVAATDDFRESMSKLKQNVSDSGASMAQTEQSFKKFHAVTDDTDSSVEALSDLLATGFDDEGMTKAVDLLAGAVIRFPDTLNIESLADSIQETVATGEATGQYAELLDRLGIGADTVTEAMAGASEEQRKWIALEVISNSKLKESFDEWTRNNGALVENRNAEVDLQNALSELAGTLLPVITSVTELTTAFIDWFNSLSKDGQNAVLVIGLIIAALGPISHAVDGAIKAFDLFKGAMNPTTVKIMAVVTALGLIVAAVADVSKAWNNMSGLEKFASAMGIAAAAAAALAVAMGAITGPWGAAAAAAAIAAGIGTALAAVNSANKRAKNSSQAMANKVNGSASGEQNRQEEAFRQQQNNGGGRGGASQMREQPVVLNLDGATLARGMVPYMNGENQRRGVQLAGG